MGEPAVPGPDRPAPAAGPARIALRPAVGPAVLVASGVALTWLCRGFFPGLLGDQGWSLRVVERLAAGETLYGDVAWAYGPLPPVALAAALRATGSAGIVTWTHGLLALFALLLSWDCARRVLDRGAALAATAYAAWVGAGYGLVLWFLLAYTCAVPWGAVAALGALAAGLRWLERPRRLLLWAAGAAAGLACLAKPEYGLGALVTALAAPLLARRRGAALTVLAIALAVTALGFSMAAHQAAWGPVLRGYTGYDLVAEGSVRLRQRLPGLASAWLLSSAALAIALRRIARPGLWAGALTAAGLGTLFWNLAGIGLGPTPRAVAVSLAQSPWILLPWALLAVGPGLFRRPAPASLRLLWIFAVAVNLRFFPLGGASTVSLAPVLALGIALHRRGRLPALRPRAAALAALPFVLASIGVDAGILTAPRRPVATTLGVVQTLAEAEPLLAEIESTLAALDTAPGPIFALGWGSAWYLLSGRVNPTPFDAVLPGLGTADREAARLLEALRERPPAALIVPRADADEGRPLRGLLDRLLAGIGRPYRPLEGAAEARWRVWTPVATEGLSARGARRECP